MYEQTLRTQPMMIQFGTQLYRNKTEAMWAAANWFLHADGLNSADDVREFQTDLDTSVTEFEANCYDPETGALPHWYDREGFRQALAGVDPEYQA